MAPLSQEVNCRFSVSRHVIVFVLISHFMCSINSVSKPELTEKIDDHHQGANKA